MPRTCDRKPVNEHTAVNRQFWDEVAPHHAASSFYGVAAFVAGADSLGDIELAEVGDVTGRDVVHLQCHLGLDTLSWARHGARVTGLDFSAESLRVARELAVRTGLAARFVEADVCAAPEALGTTYDLVFTSHGVLMWIGDLDAWARSAARLLRPGGIFYLLDIHPLGMALEQVPGGLRLAASYFGGGAPSVTVADGSYAVEDVGITGETHEWIHPVGDVATALIRAGIALEFVHEFPTDAFAPTTLSAGGDRPGVPQLPGLFSIRGHLARD